jgi:hypothetical protein
MPNTNPSSRASQTGILALLAGLAWAALPVAGLAATGCSQGPGASTTAAVVAPADAPLQILDVPASADTQARYAIASWRAFLGQQRIVVDGYGTTGTVVPGFKLAYDGLSDGHVTLQMLDGTEASLVAGASAGSVGNLSENQLGLVAFALLDIQAAAPAPAAGSLQTGGAVGASGLSALDTPEEEANCHNAVANDSNKALLGSASCVLMAVPGGASLLTKVATMLGRMVSAGAFGDIPSCMEGLMAANDLQITCNTHDGCIILPEQTPGMICPEAGTDDAGPADAGPDEEPPCPGTMGCKAGLIMRPEAGAGDGGGEGGELGGGTCDNSEHTAPAP